MTLSLKTDRVNIFCNFSFKVYFYDIAEDNENVHTTKSRTLMIYILKELAHFWSNLLVDFLHIQNTDLMPYYIEPQ